MLCSHSWKINILGQQELYIRSQRKYVIMMFFLRTVTWQNLGYIYKRRLESEMFKIVKDPGNHRLSSHFTIRETERKGKQLVVKRMNTERGRNSVTYRGPIVWNALRNSLREEDKLVSFRKKLKTNLKTLEQISFRKGTVFSNNKNLENFVYY